jgi:hypothetical protein
MRTCVRVSRRPAPYALFQRALKQGHVVHAELAARELPTLTLEDALRLVALYAETGSPKAERAALRWLSRLLDERPALTLGDACRATGALEGLLRGEAQAVLVIGAVLVTSQRR